MQHNETEKQKVPDWLLTQETYFPPADRDGFLKKTMMSVLSLLSQLKMETKQERYGKTAPALRIVGAVFLILLISLSRNRMFLWLVFAVTALRLMIMDGNRILIVWKRALSVMLISVFFMLPAALFGNVAGTVQLCVKVFLTILLLGMETQSLTWNQITAGLQSFHVPDIVIFLLDITMKYILLLGEMCYAMLQALHIRSIGKNEKKTKFYFGILGITFLKSHELSEDMVKAMECRGFDGHFVFLKKKSDWRLNLLYILMLFTMIVFFLYLNTGIRIGF